MPEEQGQAVEVRFYYLGDVVPHRVTLGEPLSFMCRGICLGEGFYTGEGLVFKPNPASSLNMSPGLEAAMAGPSEDEVWLTFKAAQA
jgi:hypothetical protein